MKYFIVGGAGFVGSHLVRILLQEETDADIVIFDNFSSGRLWHLEEFKSNRRLNIVTGDVKDTVALQKAIVGTDIVYHFASNPDISKAVSKPDIDFWEGTYLTNNLLEVMRISGIKRLLYASGSGIYGDTGLFDVSENYSPMLPISTYGASKLSCEAMISAYSHMFNISASVFRFANVVGPHQTHGVGYDFVKRLMQNPNELQILGNGSQSKSYIYVTDVINAIRLLEKKIPEVFSFYNVATTDYITVTEIANIAIAIMGLRNVEYKYTGGNRGWKGDVPIVRLNSNKIRTLGWNNQYTTKEAIHNSIVSIYKDALLNKFQWGSENNNG